MVEVIKVTYSNDQPIVHYSDGSTALVGYFIPFPCTTGYSNSQPNFTEEQRQTIRAANPLWRQHPY